MNLKKWKPGGENGRQSGDFCSEVSRRGGKWNIAVPTSGTPAGWAGGFLSPQAERIFYTAVGWTIQSWPTAWVPARPPNSPLKPFLASSPSEQGTSGFHVGTEHPHLLVGKDSWKVIFFFFFLREKNPRDDQSINLEGNCAFLILFRKKCYFPILVFFFLPLKVSRYVQ